MHSKDEARGNSRRSSHPEGQSPTRVKATSPTRRQSSGSLFYANLVEVPLASAACCARDATHAVTDAVKDAPVGLTFPACIERETKADTFCLHAVVRVQSNGNGAALHHT